MERSGKVWVLTLAAVFAVTAPVEAQRRANPSAFLGVGLVAADAVGELGLLVDRGFGLELSAGAPMTEEGHLRIRGDFGFLVYGIERLRFCSFGCRLASDLTTTNNIVFGGIGPELVFSTGDVQPYVHGSAGLSYFVTSSSLDDHDGRGPYLETTNYSDVVFGWKYGGGIRFRVGGEYKPVFIDLGVVRHDNGVTNYLTRGDIVDNPDGSVTIYPNRSDADLMSFRFGVSFGLGGR